MSDLREIHIVYKLTLGAVAVALNVLVIYLASYKLGRALKSYRKMLIIGALIDMIYSLICMFTLILIVDVGSKMVFLLDNPFLPETYGAVVSCSILWNIGLYAMVINLPAQFVYRMNIFCLNKSIRMSRFLAAFCLYFVWGCLHSLFMLITFEDENVETTRELRNKSPIFKSGEIPSYIFIDSRKAGLRLIHFLDVQPIIIIAYAIVVYCAVRINRKLEATSPNLQPPTLEAQQQLSRIMLVQAVYPVVSVLLPVGVACILPLFSISFDYLPIIITITAGTLPVCNPLIILVTIPSFRSSIRRMLFGPPPIVQVNPVSYLTPDDVNYFRRLNEWID